MWTLKQVVLGENKGAEQSVGWAVVQENLNEVGKKTSSEGHMSEFGGEVANSVKLRRRRS